MMRVGIGSDGALPVVGFDLDGTLLWGPKRWDDAEVLERETFPRYAAVAQMRAAECEPVIITGRTVAVADVSMRHFTEFYQRRGVRFYFQQAWQGWDALVRFKAAAIREAGCCAYVGDTGHDAEAAKLAGVRFLHADDFARHGLSPLFPLPQVQP